MFLIRTFFVAFVFSLPAFAQGVGDIPFDPAVDDPNFKLCNPKQVFQGYQLKSKQDETSLMVEKEFRSKYRFDESWSKQSGLIRIRFIVNCNGVAGRFRVLEISPEMKPIQFDETLKLHLLSITKNIAWPARRGWDQTVDYYHHISIRLREGKIDIVQ